MPRQLVFALACVLFAAALITGTAAGPNPADGRKIEACLKAAGEKGDSGVTCIGIVADPCIAAVRETDNGPKDAMACAARELAIWTARLQRAVQSASKGGGKSVATTVATAQKSFADSVTKLCPQFDSLDPGMAMGGASYCRLQETAMRVLVIERLAEAVNPH